MSECIPISLPVPPEMANVVLPLYPTKTILGRVSQNVIRPIHNGTVIVVPKLKGLNYGYNEKRIPINPDGTFRIDGVQEGELDIWAYADGWASQYKDSEFLDAPQSLFLKDYDQHYTLPMIATATVKLNLVDVHGKPVVGVPVTTSPNICRDGKCGVFTDKSLTGVSDSNGQVIIQNIPARKELPFVVSGDEYVLPVKMIEDRIVGRIELLDLLSGETTIRTLVVEPKNSTLITSIDGIVTTQSASQN